MAAFLFSLITFLNDGSGFVDSLLDAFFVGVFAAIGIGALGLIYLLFADFSLGILDQEIHPAVQGIKICLGFVSVLGVFDLIFLKGTFIIMPAWMLILGYGLETTYWGCETEWVTVEEGSYCSD